MPRRAYIPEQIMAGRVVAPTPMDCCFKLGSTNRGVTLIELIVGVAILALLFALGASSYSVWMQNTRVRTAAESIQNGLQIARNEAVRRNRYADFTLTSDSGWTVVVRDPTGGGDETIQTRPAQDGSGSTISTGAITATFNGMGRLDNAADLVISSTGYAHTDVESDVADTKSLRVQISVGGQIRMCDPDPAVVTGDPRRCL